MSFRVIMHLYFVNFSHYYRNIYTYVRAGVKDCVIVLYKMIYICVRVRGTGHGLSWFL